MGDDVNIVTMRGDRAATDRRGYADDHHSWL
jgi:hypothetical protein